MQQAREKQDEGKLDDAIRLYIEAIKKDRNLVRAHLDLALLLQDHAKDYSGAILHYRRYSELRPETEKKAMIQERIEQAEKSLVCDLSVPGLSGVKQAASPEKKNAAATIRPKEGHLKGSGDNERPMGGTNGLDSKSLSSQPVSAPDRKSTRTYTVKSGDNLSSIAGQIYGDKTKWRIIMNANRDLLGDSDRLKVGQLLAIP